MASIDRQQHALEVLRSINKAITNLRLYPGQSVQVVKAVEKAYSELKVFLRLYDALCFGFHKGVPTLDSFIFERKEREQLDALSLVDSLEKAGFEKMTLARGIDRKRFKQVLSFFTATPEQIQKSGGHVAFVENAGLGPVFLEDEGEEVGRAQAVVRSFADFLQQLMTAGVRQEEILFLLESNQDGQQREKMRRELDDAGKGTHTLAGAVCFVLQSIQHQGVYQSSPGFYQLLENVSAVLKDEEIRKAGTATAALLAANLDQESLALLLCQPPVTPFGEALSYALLAAIDKERFQVLVVFLRQEEARLAGLQNQSDAESRMLVAETCRYLMTTVKGRQLHAVESMGMTEKQRQSKRLQAGVSALARGSLEGLRNKEILLHLAATFERLILNKKENIAAAIIQTLVGGLKLDDNELRRRSGQGLGLVGEKLVSLDSWVWLEKLTPTFLFCLRRTEDADESCARLVAILQDILTHAQKTGREDLAEKILLLFYAIRSGALGKSAEVRERVAQVQDRGVDRTILQAYLDRCFDKPVEEMYCQKIVMHGPLGIQFLLDVLLTSKRRAERIRLLKILAGVGAAMLSSLLLERLQEPMPWYGKRNLIRLLGETGAEGDASAVQGYLSHDDLRVQSEALSCIYKIGAQQKKQYLLDALPRISEKLKFRVVLALASVVDEEVVGVLVELLEDEKYFSPDIKKTLLTSICETLGHSGSAQAQKALLLLSASGGGRPKNMDMEVRQAVQRGLVLLDASRRQKRQMHAELRKTSTNAVRQAQVMRGRPTTKVYVPVTNLTEEHDVYLLLDQNKRAAAKTLLLDLISTVACLHKFDQAELLCRRLVEIDPLALDDIIKATEMVEEQRVVRSDQGQTQNWAEVYDFLSTEEFNGLYSAMEHVHYVPDENIVVQGDLHQRLVFVNKGRVKLFFRDPRGNDILLRTVGPGDIFGVDSFFEESVWTVNAASVGTVDAFVLPREALRKWQNSFPELESKLKTFCQQLVEQDALKVMVIDRRATERLNFSARLALAILDDNGQETGTVLQSEKGDVSIGGVSATVRLSHQRSGRLLLGRKVIVRQIDGPPGTPLTAGMAGMVVAIYGQNGAGGESVTSLQYTVHVQFDHPLQEAQLAAVASGN
ncbi:MAG: cyclic nucleotide-binding domain-containing protein [Desulfoarculaceae bacterium]|nr:cyclic nucleotide-binding domain-containing protein [Desulfoarculaceae bacterium]